MLAQQFLTHTQIHFFILTIFYMLLLSLKISLVFLNSLKIIISLLKSLILAACSKTKSLGEFSSRTRLKMTCTILMLPYPIHTKKLSKVRAFLLDFNPCNVNLWHKRLGHPNYQVLSHVFKTWNLSSSLVKDVNFCDFGRYGKHCQFMFPNSLNKAKFPL